MPSVGLILSIFAAAQAAPAALSNVALPLDQNGEKLITGEASVMVYNNEYWFYFNDWGTCPGVDCCDSSAGCASCCFNNPPHEMQACSNPYGLNHTVQAYRTLDFVKWENMGVALPLSARHPGIEFRPAVVYNAKTKLFVMWYEDRASGLSGYAVATSPTPEGPFTTTHTNVGMPGKGRIGDYNIFVDDDGAAYHVRTGFDIVRLDENYTGPAEHVASFKTPKSSEGPAMFKRNGTYYITAGTGCCACIGGSTIYILSAPAPEGPWTYQGDVGSNPTPFDAHSKDNYVTKSQGSAVFKIGDQHIYLGNQWNSGLSETPLGPRHHDLLYFGVIGFEAPPAVTCREEIESHKGGQPVTFACSEGVIDKVVFSAFGTPIGSCQDVDNLQRDETCDAANATAIVESACLGKSSCSVTPDAQSVFGDPCLGTVKHLIAAVHCEGDIPAGPEKIVQFEWHDEVTVDVPGVHNSVVL